jgi:hypothetical protein
MRWHNSFSRHPSLPRQPENRPAGCLSPRPPCHQRRIPGQPLPCGEPETSLSKTLPRPMFLAIKCAVSRPAVTSENRFQQSSARVLSQRSLPPTACSPASRYLGSPTAATSHQERVLRPASVPQPSQCYPAHGSPLSGLLVAADRLTGRHRKSRFPGKLPTWLRRATGALADRLARAPVDTACRCVGIRSALVTGWLIAGSPAPARYQGKRMVRGSQAARRQGNLEGTGSRAKNALRAEPLEVVMNSLPGGVLVE